MTSENDWRDAMRPKGGMAAARQQGNKATSSEVNETPRKMIDHTGATLVRVSPASYSGDPHG